MTFSSKRTTVSEQGHFSDDRGHFADALVPLRTAVNTTKGTLVEGVHVTTLMHQFDRCHVYAMVRLKKADDRLVMEEEGLDEPGAEPWFLIWAVKDGRIAGRHAFWFLVNGNYGFHPVTEPVSDHPETTWEKRPRACSFKCGRSFLK